MARLRGDVRRFQAAADRLERGMAQAFIEAVRTMRGQVDLDALTAAIEAGNIAEAARLADINPAALYPLTEAQAAAFVAGGRTIAEGIPARAGVLGFDGRAVRAERWLSQQSSRLVREITDDHRAMVRDVLERQLAAGQAPRSSALDLVGRINRATGRREGGFIGLTQQQADAVLNARDDLQNLSGRYFNRELRDRRFDSVVRRAIAEDRPLSQAQIDRITQAYRNRFVRFRGETISQTESLTALRAGRDEGLRQAAEQDIIREDRIARVWDATMDSRTRPDHAAMEGVRVEGTDEPFVLPDGSRMMYPGDTSLGAAAAQVIRCRCFVRHDVDFLKA